MARSNSHPGARAKFRERAFNESCLADRLIGRAPGALGRDDRQPYWLTEHLISWSLQNRQALASHGRWPSSLQPQLQPHQLHPLVRKAAATMLQLSMHRYHTVAAHAAGCLAPFSYSTCSTLERLMVPAITSAAALLTSDPDAVGLPPGAVTAAGGFSLPSNAEATAALLEAQASRLTALVCAEDNGQAVADAVAGDARGDGVCTSENKHTVTGALALAEHLQRVLPVLISWPEAMSVLFMAVLVMQRYFLPVSSPPAPCLAWAV